MKIKLLKKLHKKYLLVLIGTLTFGFMGAQTISYSWSPAEPNVFNFELTNGNGGTTTHFNTSTTYRLQVSTSPGAFATWTTREEFQMNNPPVGDGVSASYQRNFSIPPSYSNNSVVYVRVLPISPTIRIDGIHVDVIRDLEYEGNEPGFIQCQTPAFSYRYITITNTGNAVDSYNISFINEHPSQFATTALNFDFDEITTTPNIQPGNQYTFVVKVYLTHGTAPGDENNTTIFLESTTDNTFIEEIVFLTTAYCGNGNGGNNPDMPDAPDLGVNLDLINELDEIVPVADVGGTYRYRVRMTSFLQNKGVRNPVMAVTFPDNVELGQLSYSVSSTINENNLDYSLIDNIFTLTYITGNSQNNFFKLEDQSITFYLEVFINCDDGSEMSAFASVSSSQGDSNTSNDEEELITNIVINPNQPDVGLWQGESSTDWFDCLNWKKGVIPNSSVDVTIPSTAPNQPVIDFDSPLRDTGVIAQAANITIIGGASLTMIDTSELQVFGSWSNNGIFIPGNGTVGFVGFESDQTIFDLSEEPTFNILTINTSNDFKVLIPDDQGLHVDNQLNLESGVLRLEGMSQLLQPDGATVIATTGKLWRDQQGHANTYNYNYWSSPVGSSVSNFTIASVMKDGSDSTNPQNIQWTGDDDGAPTTPITISNRWLYKFESTGPLYANWQKIYQNTSVQAGLGFTMKGSGSQDPTQNYTFVGIPFTGNINHTISDGQISLLGNPYASALDANQFIEDNENTIDGTLEFWDHFITTDSHYLDQYKGGYAKYNLTDQIAAVNVDNVSGTKEPQQFIPVGQGFFVTAEPGISNNSPIVFRNSQRAFVKENDAGGMQMFGIPDGSNASTGTFDGPTKIKLNMISAGDYKHQIAIGFMQDKATEGIDYGYDAKLRDTDPNQFYFMHPDEKLVIQGVGYFEEDKKYPLGVIAEFQGRYTFSVDHIENLDENTPVYLYDNEKQIYHNLRKSDYLVNLSKGEHNTRFSLRFKNHIQDNNQNAQELLNTIAVYRQNDFVVISNPSEQLTVLNAQMYNVLGQEVTSWNITNGRENYIELPLGPVATGIYVVQVQTDNGVVSKKINVR